MSDKPEDIHEGDVTDEQVSSGHGHRQEFAEAKAKAIINSLIEQGFVAEEDRAAAKAAIVSKLR